ncbi:MAG TPA: ribonuclease Z [Methanocorpusculum sp.]|nr:ribonuclease Z [Methanocorpusculum sp.]
MAGGETLFVHFLGTAGALPTPNRNPSSVMIRRGSDILLFDCGEGTQQQMMRAKTGFTPIAIFISHWHADHYLGIFGLVETMSFNGRTDPLDIYGPRGVESIVSIIHTLTPKIPFEIRAFEVKDGSVIQYNGYSVSVFKTYHGIDSVGYILEEESRPGRFNRDAAIALNIPPGPLFGKLQRGETIRIYQNDNTEITVSPDQVLGLPRPGRKVVYTGDTRPILTNNERLYHADLLIHEATFDEDEGIDRAKKVWHSTAFEAGMVANVVKPKILALTHFSSRYTSTYGHIKSARKSFNSGQIIAPTDLYVIGIPFTDE